MEQVVAVDFEDVVIVMEDIIIIYQAHIETRARGVTP